jgi:Threonine dehydrogenase and related Zn-dependent dehydrogenases
MLAAKLYGVNDVRVTECEIPSITDDEILLKTGAAAICGSDLRMIGNGYQGVDGQHPLTLGHEIAGIIERVGKNVKEYQPGMRVSLAPNMGCGVCEYCVSGNTHLCPEYQAFGINVDGGFAEYVRVPASAVTQGNILVLDEKIPFEVAAVFEPMSCVLNGQQRVQIHLNDTVLIIGAGPIGIMHALLAKASGASKIFIRDLSRERMEQCVRIDPDMIPIDRDDLTAAVRELTNGRGLDVCIVACPSGAAQADSPELMAMNGRILFFGGLPAGKDRVTLQTNLIHYRQLGIFGSARANVSQYRDVAKMVSSGRLDLAKVVSKTFGLRDFPDAVQYAKSAQGLKTVLTF